MGVRRGNGGEEGEVDIGTDRLGRDGRRSSK